MLLEKLALLTRQLQQVPIDGQLRRATRQDPTFPDVSTFRRWLGLKENWATHVIAFCESHPEFEDVGALWRQISVRQKPANEENTSSTAAGQGHVYLLRHGSRHEYRIGCTTNVLRRHGEIAIELPQKVQPVHVIATDDPYGIEAYWHKRFESKRLNGDWFALTAQDVAAFKRRRKYM
jgi:hypothetical protein